MAQKLMAKRDELIRVTDLRKSYPLGDVSVEVLKGVSFAIERGEFVALTGSSGSGKSTLMNILGCLDRPTGGQFFLDGVDASTLSAEQRADIRRDKIGFVFQSFQLLARTSALDNVIMPLTYSPLPVARKDSEAWGRELLAQVGLAERAEHLPNQLSGGQQQRVALARALVNRPSLLLADEPTGNLDTVTTEEILTLLRKLNTEQKLTVIIVTHEPDVAAYADRQIRMRDGCIEEVV